MNDVCNVSNISQFVLHADDTTIFTSDKNMAKPYSENDDSDGAHLIFLE